MKYILILLMLGAVAKGQAINHQIRKADSVYCPASVDHVHHFNNIEKCNFYGCGAICDCGAKKFYKSGLVILNHHNTAEDYNNERKIDSVTYMRRRHK